MFLQIRCSSSCNEKYSIRVLICEHKYLRKYYAKILTLVLRIVTVIRKRDVSIFFHQLEVMNIIYIYYIYTIFKSKFTLFVIIVQSNLSPLILFQYPFHKIFVFHTPLSPSFWTLSKKQVTSMIRENKPVLFIPTLYFISYFSSIIFFHIMNPINNTKTYSRISFVFLFSLHFYVRDAYIEKSSSF